MLSGAAEVWRVFVFRDNSLPASPSFPFTGLGKCCVSVVVGDGDGVVVRRDGAVFCR